MPLSLRIFPASIRKTEVNTSRRTSLPGFDRFIALSVAAIIDSTVSCSFLPASSRRSGNSPRPRSRVASPG